MNHSLTKTHVTLPANGQKVLVTLESRIVTGAEYIKSIHNIQERFTPVGIKIDNKCDYKDNCYSFPVFDSKIISWSPLNE